MSKKARKTISPNHQFQLSVLDIEMAKQKTVHDAVRITHYLPLLILKNTFGFGEKRLRQFQEDYVEMWQHYNTNDVKLNAVAEIIEGKSGIVLTQPSKISPSYDVSEHHKKITVSKKELDAIKKQAMNDALSVTSHFPLYVLLREWSFGNVRLNRFYDEYITLTEDIRQNKLDIETIAQVLDQQNNITWDEY